MKTLIVIDMQNDFVTGVLGSKEAVAVLPNVKKKIDAYIAAGDEVIFTRDTHEENYLETNEGAASPCAALCQRNGRLASCKRNRLP